MARSMGSPCSRSERPRFDRALVCVLDLEDYELVLMNASEDKSDFLDLTVDPLNLEDAERRVRESPSIRESMYEGKHASRHSSFRTLRPSDG